MADDKLLQYYTTEAKHAAIKVYRSIKIQCIQVQLCTKISRMLGWIIEYSILPSKSSVSVRISPIHMNMESQTVQARPYMAWVAVTQEARTTEAGMHAPR